MSSYALRSHSREDSSSPLLNGDYDQDGVAERLFGKSGFHSSALSPATKRKIWSLIGWGWFAFAIILPWALYLSSGKSTPEQIKSLASSGFSPLKLQDVALIIKTGASVIHDRLPVHFVNEFADRELPPLQVYSDYPDELTLNGKSYTVIDILADTPNHLREQPDFSGYLEQKKLLDTGQSLDNVKGHDFDKYKFLPMAADSYKRFPNAKFFINVEADTYLYLDNLMRWLAQISPDGQTIFGSQVLIIDAQIWFAHGGTGWVHSRGLMDATFGKDFDGVLRSMDHWLLTACCGDELLARALFNFPGVYLKGPNYAGLHLFTGEPPWDNRFWSASWCSPVMTHHHVSAEDIEQLYQFERSLWPRLLPDDYIRRRDVFDHFMPDFLHDSKEDEHVEEGWTIHVGEMTENDQNTEHPVAAEDGVPFDAQFCSDACKKWSPCIVWRFRDDVDGKACDLGNAAVIGHRQNSHTSGWRLDRIRDIRASAWCENRPMLSA